MEDERIVSLLDENGKEMDFEIIADLEVNDQEYAVLLPLDGSDEAVLFKVIDNGEEAILEFVEDDDEFNMVSEAYMELIEEEEE